MEQAREEESRLDTEQNKPSRPGADPSRTSGLLAPNLTIIFEHPSYQPHSFNEASMDRHISQQAVALSNPAMRCSLC